MPSKDTKEEQDKIEIYFRLNQNQQPPPPYELETVWAREKRPGFFLIESIPLWVDGVSCYDEVRVEEINGQLFFKEIASSKGHSLLRAYVDTYDIAQQVCSELENVGCTASGIERNGLYILGIDVPFKVSLDEIITYLTQQSEANGLEFEGASIRHLAFRSSLSQDVNPMSPSPFPTIKPPKS